MENKKSFERPELVIVLFTVEDIITGSLGGDSYNPDGGDVGEIEP